MKYSTAIKIIKRAQLLPLIWIITFLSFSGYARSSDLGRMLSSSMRPQEDVPYPVIFDDKPYFADFPIVDSVYIVGPGDFFQISLESVVGVYQVNPEGSIILTNIGEIPVTGLTLKAAKQKILQQAESAKIKSQCFVNLSYPKIMRVFISGAVVNQGIFQIRGNARVSDLFEIGLMFLMDAQMDNIRITSQDGREKNVYIKKFLVDGDLSGNPYLEQGDKIFVPYIDYEKPYVTIRRDSSESDIQLNPGETVFDLLLKFYHYRAIPPLVTVVVSEKNGKETFLSSSKVRNYQPQNGAYIETSFRKKDIYVGGEVSNPGYVRYNPENQLIQYVSQAGILSSSRISRKMTVIRENGDILKISSSQGRLLPGDVVIVKENLQKKILLYTPIVLSFSSIIVAIITLRLTM